MSEKQIQEQVMKAQGFAGKIEFILRDIFECDRFGFGGQVTSDKIRKLVIINPNAYTTTNY